MRFIIVIIALFVFSSCQNTVPQNVLKDNKSLKVEKGILLYQDNVFSGDVLAYIRKGKLSYSCSYVDGVKHGKETKWYANGLLKMQRFYTKGIKTGVHKGWWDNGIIKYEYHFNNKGEHQGIAFDYFMDGSPYRLFHYENGKEEGSQKIYSKQGKLRANYVVVNGERFGLIGVKKCDAVPTMY